MEFVDIIGYEGLYKINRLGDVVSVKRGIVLKSNLGIRGYKRVCLYKDGKRKHFRIHRLIMIHFIPNPDNLRCVDHINRIKTDNRIENLRWSSHLDNTINTERVEKRKGHIETKTYKCKDGTFTRTYVVRYNLSGQHGNQNRKSKTFKTREEAVAFRNEIYNL